VRRWLVKRGCFRRNTTPTVYKQVSSLLGERIIISEVKTTAKDESLVHVVILQSRIRLEDSQGLARPIDETTSIQRALQPNNDMKSEDILDC
jgi:hypothetical protein